MKLTKEDWILEYTAALIANGTGEGTAKVLAKATAYQHELHTGHNVSDWSWQPGQSVRPRFNTSDNSDIGIDDAEPEKERPD